MKPSEKIRLVSFFKKHLGEHGTPTFWEGEALIPSHPFHIKIRESSEDQWVWEAAFEYNGSVMHTIQTNTFSDHFAFEIHNVFEALVTTLKDDWQVTADDVVEYVSSAHNLSMEQDTDPYEQYEDLYYGKNFTKWIWAKYEKGDPFDTIQSAIILYVFESSEPVLVLESELLDVRYVYSIPPNDLGYREALQNFLDDALD